MSSTNKNPIESENYPTPIPVVMALLNNLVVRPDDTFLEPCKGEGNILNSVPLPAKQKFWAEIADGVDYLEASFTKKDIIITNPPFSLTEEFVSKMFSELADDGTLVFLQRVNFLGSLKRVDFWREIGFPDKTPIIVPRPRFVRGKSDSCEYVWMIYDRGNRFPFIRKGLSHLITR